MQNPDWWDGSADKHLTYDWQLELDSWDPYDLRREAALGNCSLSSTHTMARMHQMHRHRSKDNYLIILKDWQKLKYSEPQLYVHVVGQYWQPQGPSCHCLQPTHKGSLLWLCMPWIEHATWTQSWQPESCFLLSPAPWSACHSSSTIAQWLLHSWCGIEAVVSLGKCTQLFTSSVRLYRATTVSNFVLLCRHVWIYLGMWTGLEYCGALLYEESIKENGQSALREYSVTSAGSSHPLPRGRGS